MRCFRRWPRRTGARNLVPGLLALILVTGCAGVNAATQPPAAIPDPPAASVPAAFAQADSPSASARMICGPEIARDVALLMRAPVEPGTATWQDHLYTCTYHLPGGSLVVAVKDAAGVPAAQAYFNTVQQQLGATQPLTGAASLGLPAFQTEQGVVGFLKDDKTLEVDASGLPGVVGPQSTTRANLAYELASDVLGCWAGD